MNQSCHRARCSIADLKPAIFAVLEQNSDSGMTNAEIGRTLGIYAGHVRHEGHIPRTLLAIMESEEVVQQDKTTKR